MESAKRFATIEDLEALPRDVKGEIIEGTWGDETDARIPPFEAVPLDVKSFWT